MNVDYVRQVAAECDNLLALGRSDNPPGLDGALAVRVLARAAAVLNMVVLPPGSHGDRPNGSSASPSTDKPEASQETTTDVDPELSKPTTDPRTAARNFRASAAKIAKGVNPHSKTWEAGCRHGYLMAADALDEVADATDQHKAFIQGQLKDRRERLAGAEKSRDSYRKRWHATATQRDALVQAAVPLLKGPVLDHLPALREAVEQIEAGGMVFPSPGNRLRRELWHVLDRMPAGDDDLIATVKKQAVDLEDAGVFLTVVRSVLRDTGRPPALRLEDIATAVRDLEHNVEKYNREGTE